MHNLEESAEKKFGVLLVNLGSPKAASAAEIRKFLKQFLSDPRVIQRQGLIWQTILRLFILPFRPRKLIHSYQEIFSANGSPLIEISQQQAQGLRKSLNQYYATEIPLALAMTYGEPSIKQGLLELKTVGVDRVLVLPLYPQYSATTTAAVFDQIAANLKKCPHLPRLRMLNEYHTDPGYIRAVANSIRKHWQENSRGEKLLFSFHGIPQYYVDQGDPYAKQCEATTKKIVSELGLADDEWILCYQSRFGPTKWLQPYTIETVEQLAQTGVKSLDIISPGFAVDCLETLEELKIQNRDVFLQHGGEEFNYIPALNADPEHIQVLCDLIVANSKNWSN